MDIKTMSHSKPTWGPRGTMIVGVKLPRREDGTRQWIEELWCRPLGERRYELCCIPFWLPGLALGQTIATDGALPATHCAVAQDAGHATFTVWFDQPGYAAVRQEVPGLLAALGCELEWYHDLCAVDARDESIARSAYELLYQRQERHQLRFNKPHIPSIVRHRQFPNHYYSDTFVYAGLIAERAPWRMERLAARAVGQHRWELTDIPIFAYGFAWGDLVETKPNLDELAEQAIIRVIQRSGHATFRVAFTEASPPGTQEEVLAEMERLDCPTERFSPLLIAINAPPGQVQTAFGYLERRHNQGHLVVEAGTPHPPSSA